MADYECTGCGIGCCTIGLSADDYEPRDVIKNAVCPQGMEYVNFKLQDSTDYGCREDGTHLPLCRHCKHNPNSTDATKPNSCALNINKHVEWTDTCDKWEDCKPTEEEIDQFHEDMEQKYLRETENTCGVCIWWHPEYVGSGGCTDGCSYPNRTGDEHTAHSTCDCDGWERTII